MKGAAILRPLPALALFCLLGFAAMFPVALHTGQGLHDDATLFHDDYGTKLPVRVVLAAVATVVATAGLLGLLSLALFGSFAPLVGEQRE